MEVTIITAEDFELFKAEFFSQFEKLAADLKELTAEKQKNKTFEYEGKRWIKSHQVQRLLGISPGTLQNLRINGTMPFTKIGGVIYYSQEDINSLMQRNMRIRKIQ